MRSETVKGLLFALGAYGCWGFIPLYFKAMAAISEGEIFVHRIFWSVLFTAFLLVLIGRWKHVWPHLKTPRTLLVLCASAIFIAINWIVFIWASNNNRLLDTSLGYYINPLINVLFGLVFLGEKLRPWQWLAVALATLAVLLQIITLGKLPVISLTLAFAFGFYGLMRKIIKVGALEGLFIETLLLLPPTLLYFLFFSEKLSFVQAGNNFWFALALIAAGPITSIPLLLFAAGVSRLNYSTIGFIQYLAPSIVFFLAIFWFKEPLVWQMALTFILIWTALVIYSFDGWRRSRTLPAPPE